MKDGADGVSAGDDVLARIAESAAAGAGGALAGATAGAVGGPIGMAAGSVFGGVLGTGVATRIIQGRAQKRMEYATRMLELAVDSANVSADEFVSRVQGNAGTERLTSAAIECSIETSYEEKLGAIAETLAAGLSADGRPQVDRQLVIVDALRAMEPVHVWVLDRVVQWEPLSSTGKMGEAASSVLLDGRITDDERRPRWTRETLMKNFLRHQPPDLFESVFRSLARHGLLDDHSSPRDWIEAFGADLTDQFRAAARGYPSGRAQLKDMDEYVVVTPLGMHVHQLLVENAAITSPRSGTLDLDPTLRHHRGLPHRLAVHLSDYAEQLGLDADEARSLEARARRDPDDYSAGVLLSPR